MSDAEIPAPGTIIWTDLTVENADKLRDFYSDVAGWEASPVTMGDYQDFNMNSRSTGQPVAGICNARGPNAELPPQWLIYITVEDVAASASKCEALGGKVIVGPKGMGTYGRYCVIQDPAGAVAALFTPASK